MNEHGDIVGPARMRDHGWEVGMAVERKADKLLAEISSMSDMSVTLKLIGSEKSVTATVESFRRTSGRCIGAAPRKRWPIGFGQEIMWNLRRLHLRVMLWHACGQKPSSGIAHVPKYFPNQRRLLPNRISRLER